MIDSHIHLDQFQPAQIHAILTQPLLKNVIAVGTNLASNQRLYQLKQQYPHIHIAAGFHPEQPLPSPNEIDALFDWIAHHHTALCAIGEVGLPHYTHRTQPHLDYAPYLALLERFIQTSLRYDLPLNLHIVHEDTALALDLLAQYQMPQAHFHWFKACQSLTERLLATPYLVSLTPDILWNTKTQYVAEIFPLHRLMIETDAPYPQEGFAPSHITAQLQAVIAKLADIKHLPCEIVAQQVLQNTQAFYRIGNLSAGKNF